METFQTVLLGFSSVLKRKQKYGSSSVRNSLQSSGGPIGPLGSEVQWPLLKLDGPNVNDYIFTKMYEF